MKILSLGAGVQSTTLALMSKHKEIEMPDCAIFADTGAEPPGVYEHLTWLMRVLPFPVYTVRQKDGLKSSIIDATRGKRFASPPFYTESNTKKGGMLRRQCTLEFKINPIYKKTRKLLGLVRYERNKKKVIQYIGISSDEATRMKPAKEKWIETQWPLIDKNMSRKDCIDWLKKNNYTIPGKSSCTFCPYHNNSMWRDIKKNDTQAWLEAVHIDRLIRNGIRGTKQKLFVHRSLKPLEKVDFDSLEDKGQLNLFENECEGICGN